MRYAVGMIEPAALLFDMDGLMIDSEPWWFEVERDYARAHGAAWSLADAQSGAGGGLRRAAIRIGEAIARLGGAPQDPDAGVADLVRRFLARLEASRNLPPDAPGALALKPGCLELIAAARATADGAPPLAMAVASSNVRAIVTAVLAHFGLARHFDAVVTGDDIIAPKPAPDVFLEAARRLGIPPSACVVLEDAVAGATAGHAAGMHVIAVPEHGTHVPRSAFDGIATYVVRDLFEARTHLRLPADRGSAGPTPAPAPRP